MRTILAAGGLSLIFTLVGTHFFIKFLVARGYGQFVRDDGPETHSTKRGTPTMGGLVIIFASVMAYFLAHLITGSRPSVSGMLVLALIVATGFLGFLDDWSKISHQRSMGLSPRAKIIGQTLIGVGFGFLALQFPDQRGVRVASQNISFTSDIEWARLPIVFAIVWMTLLIIAASNAVNLTDGLDGLATGVLTLVFAAFVIINIWQRNQWCGLESRGPMCYEVRNPVDLTVVSLALAAACFGFLWWNAKPAKIFLGDTGSLALGAGVAGLAITTRTEILLVILGGLFVIETLSVMIQVLWFKKTRKRVFKMAPLHHHFELMGWQEVTVVIRFWIISGLFVVAAVCIFYGEWVLAN